MKLAGSLMSSTPMKMPLWPPLRCMSDAVSAWPTAPTRSRFGRPCSRSSAKPSDPKADDYEKVKAAQRHSVGPVWDICVNYGGRGLGRLHSGRSMVAQPTEMPSDEGTSPTDNAARSIEFGAS
jgi:hypothetical protein